MTRDKVFVCGGRSDNCVYVLEGNGTVKRLPSMHTARRYAGVVYDPTTTTAYVFGGLVAEYTDKLRSCEKIVLKRPHLWSHSPRWELLPPMNRERAYFNPCLHASIVYISGGGYFSMETYNLNQNAFKLIFDFGACRDVPCNIVKESDTLVVLSVDSVYLWSLSQSRMMYSQNRQGHCCWSNCPAVMGDGVLYVLHEDMCQAITIETGAVEELRALSRKMPFK